MISHDENKKKFYVIKDSSESHLLYRISEDHLMDIYSTYVPENHRGQGLAKKLVEEALKMAKKENLKINPTCSYVKDYFDKNPELKTLLA